MKLDERDRRLLAALGTRPCSIGELESALEDPPGDLAGRLDALADNGLVYDEGEGSYERTESGRRVLVASAGGTADERVDTGPAVERALEELDLRSDEADAVRHAYSFLRYWGRVTDAELVDAIYSEAPAGRESGEEWLEGLVRDALASLPGVEAPGGDDEPWRFAGEPEAAEPGSDGRRVLSRTHPVYGDVKHALESLDLAALEREAARAAFAFLYRRGEATGREVREAVFPGHDAGYDSPSEWWRGVIEPAFEALPGVERAGDEQWRYRRA